MTGEVKAQFWYVYVHEIYSNQKHGDFICDMSAMDHACTWVHGYACECMQNNMATTYLMDTFFKEIGAVWFDNISTAVSVKKSEDIR